MPGAPPRVGRRGQWLLTGVASEQGNLWSKRLVTTTPSCEELEAAKVAYPTAGMPVSQLSRAAAFPKTAWKRQCTVSNEEKRVAAIREWVKARSGREAEWVSNEVHPAWDSGDRCFSEHRLLEQYHLQPCDGHCKFRGERVGAVKIMVPFVNAKGAIDIQPSTTYRHSGVCCGGSQPETVVYLFHSTHAWAALVCLESDKPTSTTSTTSTTDITDTPTAKSDEPTAPNQTLRRLAMGTRTVSGEIHIICTSHILTSLQLSMDECLKRHYVTGELRAKIVQLADIGKLDAVS